MPIAPDFEDPPSVPNSPPYFFNSDPPAEKAVSAPIVFSVLVLDPNPQDKLYVRWIGDYPPYTPFVSAVLTPLDGMVTQDPNLGGAKLTFDTGGESNPGSKMKCADFSPVPGPNHTIALIVADRPFVPSDSAPNPDYRYNAISATENDVAIMQVWKVSCQ